MSFTTFQCGKVIVAEFSKLLLQELHFLGGGGEEGKEEPRGLRKSILLGVTCEGPEHSPC